ncbi:MAG: hypothetical protein ACFFDI_20565 [Promethearchaeota archaeon]
MKKSLTSFQLVFVHIPGYVAFSRSKNHPLKVAYFQLPLPLTLNRTKNYLNKSKFLLDLLELMKDKAQPRPISEDEWMTRAAKILKDRTEHINRHPKWGLSKRLVALRLEIMTRYRM